MTDLNDPLGLFKDIKEAEKEEPAQFKHNWLYSVLPYTKRTQFPAAEKDFMAIAGYCRACDQAFAVYVDVQDTSYDVILHKLNIPKWGCINPVEEHIQ